MMELKKLLLSMSAIALSLGVASAAVETSTSFGANVGECAGGSIEDPSAAKSFNGFYVGVGIGGAFHKDKANLNGIKNHRLNRFVGVLSVGGGKVFANSLYLGGDVILDISKRKDDGVALTAGVDGKIKTCAVSPSVGIRAGYVISSLDALLYGKVAGVYVHKKLEASDGVNYVHLKSTKIIPALAIGAEKAFGRKLSTRVECEYQFASKEKFFGGTWRPKLGDGVNVRALIKYNVNF